MKHKPIPKELRERVYEKYNGHCAYCSCKLDYKDMQVDHLKPIWHTKVQDDSFENLMPSCRSCNLYKNGNSLNTFREMLANKFSTILKRQKLAEKYGIKISEWNKKFYFENVK